jgi:hypothetical protein
MLLRGRFFTFIVKAIGFLIVISVVWYFIISPYNRLLLAAADKITSPELTLSLKQNTIYLYLQDLSSPIGGIYVLALHYGLIVVVSLILATPGLRIYQRLRSIAISLLAIFAVHLITVVLFAQTALSGAATSMEQNPLIVLFAIIGADLFPILIWGILSYKYFLTKPRKSVARDKTKASEYKVSEMRVS